MYTIDSVGFKQFINDVVDYIAYRVSLQYLHCQNVEIQDTSQPTVAELSTAWHTPELCR